PPTMILFTKPGDLLQGERLPFTTSIALSPPPSPRTPAKQQVALRTDRDTTYVVWIIPSDTDLRSVRKVPERNPHVAFAISPKHRVERPRRPGRTLHFKCPDAIR